jgi:hypothetical protein
MFYTVVKILSLVKMMRGETHGNGYTSSIKCPHALKNISLSLKEGGMRVPPEG